MARRGSNYTPIGHKISNLATSQIELSKVLDLTQQSVSGKLTGKIAVTLNDLEALGKHYNAPMIYFFVPRVETVEQARAWDQAMSGSHEFHQAMSLMGSLPEPFVKEFCRILMALRATADYYTNPSHEAQDVFPPSYRPKIDPLEVIQPNTGV